MDYVDHLKHISLPNKYSRWCIDIILQAIVRDTPKCVGHEQHHIIPKSFGMGGARDRNNIVVLTIREHFLVHLLMTKMFVGEHQKKMRYAFWAMCAFSKERRQNSRFYEVGRRTLSDLARGRKPTLETRAKLSLALKGKMVGDRNPMFGKTGPRHHGYGLPGNFTGRKHSDATKSLISKNNIMKKDRMISARSRWDSESRLDHAIAMTGSGNNNASCWVLTNEKEVLETCDLKNLCSERGWNYRSLMTRRSQGKPYKGYIVTDIR